MKNIPSQGFRHQSVKLWNSKTSVDMRNAKMTTRALHCTALQVLQAF
jgi:hypothetical protein